MELYQRLALRGLTLLAVLTLASGCEARTSTTQKANYDYYLLALSLAPAFCEDAATRQVSDLHPLPRQCQNLDGKGFKRMPLTLHGLWPNNRSGKHPLNCGAERRAGGMCSLPALALPGEVATRLEETMPGKADCLDRHEWVKHGSCSGLTMADYFDQSIELTERANRSLAGVLREHAGREVALEILRDALRKQDPALLESVSFDCRTPRSRTPARRKPMLREVRLYFHVLPDGRPGQPLNYREAGVKHFNSGCPGGKAFVDMP